MKLLIIILMTCGQPDLVIVKPQDGPVMAAPYSEVDKRALQETIDMNNSEVWIMPDERGICA